MQFYRDVKDVDTLILYIHDRIGAFFNVMERISNLEVYGTIIVITAIIFIIMHYLRNKGFIFAQISIFLGFFPVLMHELGHAITAFLVGGKVGNIRMNLTKRSQNATKAQGYAEVGGGIWISKVLYTFMGYATAPLLFYIGVGWISTGHASLFIICLMLAMCFYATHTRQIWIPLLIILFFGFTEVGMNITTSSLAITPLSMFYSVLLGLLLGETIQSLFIITKVTFTRDAFWDGSDLAELTYIPQVVWLIIYILISYNAVKYAFLQYIFTI